MIATTPAPGPSTAAILAFVSLALPPLSERRVLRGSYGSTSFGGWPAGLMADGLSYPVATRRLTSKDDRLTLARAIRAELADVDAFLRRAPGLAAEALRVVIEDGPRAEVALIAAHHAAIVAGDHDAATMPGGRVWEAEATLGTTGTLGDTDALRVLAADFLAADAAVAEHRAAIRDTLSDLDCSPRAMSALVEALRLRLPYPDWRDVTDLAVSWVLHAFPGVAVSSSVLWPAYVEAGSPGSLGRTSLFTALDARLGARPPRRRGGEGWTVPLEAPA